MKKVSFLEICQIYHALHHFLSEFHGESKNKNKKNSMQIDKST